MICPICKCEMRVVDSYNTIVNDDTAEQPTRLYRVLVHRCVNKKCANDNAIKQSVELELKKEETDDGGQL